jgi:hypothetical protein
MKRSRRNRNAATVVRADPARLTGLPVTVAKNRVTGSSRFFVCLLLLRAQA